MITKLSFARLFSFVAVLLTLSSGDVSGQSRDLEVVSKDEDKCCAVLVGVTDYENLTRLTYTVPDVLAVKEELIKIGFPAESIKTFVSGGKIWERPEKERIEKALDEVLTTADPNSTIFILLSGHGFETKKGESMFCPEGAEVEEIDGKPFVTAATTISVEKLMGDLEKSKAKFKMLVVDACRVTAGTKGFESGMKGMKSIQDVPDGVAFLQSCSSGEESFEDPEFGHGVFTHYFVEALGGAAAEDESGVSFLDVCRYVSRKTPAYVKQRRDKSQKPRFKFDGSDFIISEQGKKPVRELPQDYLNANGQEFRLIPAGSFMMGNSMTPEEIHEKYPGGKIEYYQDAPSHKVTISKPFYMSKYETTVADFRKFVDATGYKTDAEKKGKAWGFDYEAGEFKEIDGLNWKNPGFKGFEQSSVHPVVCVSWNDAQAYLDWMNKKAEFDPELGFKPFYRLPTEAEWEYACRAGSRTEFFWGNEPKGGDGYLNAADESGAPNGGKWSDPFPFNDGYVTTAPVGSFKPNDWGLYDMLGNVNEWTLDYYDADYYKTAPSVDPRNTTTSSGRVFRGGSWFIYAEYCRSAGRIYSDPSLQGINLGFRFLLSSSSK